MVKELTCWDCVHYSKDGICLFRHISLPECCNICPFFTAYDGSRPRFCRFANSVDEMAEALVRHQTWYSDDLHKMLVDSAKNWLMELEK